MILCTRAPDPSAAVSGRRRSVSFFPPHCSDRGFRYGCSDNNIILHPSIVGLQIIIIVSTSIIISLNVGLYRPDL